MSGWTRIVFEPAAGATVAGLAAALVEAVEEPEMVARDDRLVWKEYWEFDVERVRHLDVPAASVLVTRTEDTAGTGSWYRFERIDGEFVLVDAVTGGEHRYGADADDVLYLEYGVGEVPR